MASQRVSSPARTGPRRMRDVLGDPGLRIPLTYFIVAQLLDILTTLMGVFFGLDEMNPVTASVLGRFGGFGLVVQKIPTILAVGAAVAALPRRAAIIAAWAFTVLMAAVVASNVGLILAHR